MCHTHHMTTTGYLVLNSDLAVSMVTSTGAPITAIKRTAKQVHVTTISAVDGKPLTERLHPEGMTFIRNS